MEKGFVTKRKAFFVGYIFVLMLFMYKTDLCLNTYYYWDWSHHLQLSYYDGSPLIAYVIYLYTKIFGQHEFSLWLIGLTAVAITGWTIYRVAFMLFGEKTANYAALIWLLTPGVLRYFVFQVTYNAPMIVFWGLTLYFFVLLINTKKTIYFYLCGVSIGLLILSKYTGILLCVSLLIVCFFYKKYFFVLKNKHCYMAMLLATLLCSPILIWNFQHHWISFLYQLHHGYVGGKTFALRQYILSNIEDYNAPLFFLVLLGVKNYKLLLNERIALLTVPTLFVWLFFSVSTSVQGNWNSPFYFTGVILLSFLLSLHRYNQYILAAIFSCLIFSSGLLLINYRTPSLYVLAGAGRGEVTAIRMMAQKIDPKIYKNNLIFGNGDYNFLSLAHFFLNEKPDIYSMNLQEGNQYYLWWLEQSRNFLQKNVVLVSLNPHFSAKDSPFQQCVLLDHEQYIQHRWLKTDYLWNLYVYRCRLLA